MCCVYGSCMGRRGAGGPTGGSVVNTIFVGAAPASAGAAILTVGQE